MAIRKATEFGANNYGAEQKTLAKGISRFSFRLFENVHSIENALSIIASVR